MKKFYLLILALLFIPLVLAGDVEIDDVRAYVNNERVSGVDEDGGDIELFRDDILELIITIDNKMNKTTQARIKGTLEDIDKGEDIIKEHDWFDIDDDSDRSKTLSFHIPDDADIDTYDLELEVEYRDYNGTEHTWEETYDIDVKKGEEEEIDLKDSFNNLTSTCNNIVTSLDMCLGYIDRNENCSDELSTCRTDMNTFKNENTHLENQVNSMFTPEECYNRTAISVNKAKKEHTNTYAMVAFVVVGIWWYQGQKKKKSMPVSSPEYYHRSM